jgi:hypothetical protein
MKIQDEQLNQIKSLRKEIGEVSMQIASLEVQKHTALHMFAAKQAALNKITEELTKEHGAQATVDLETGIVSVPDQKTNGKVVPLKKT